MLDRDVPSWLKTMENGAIGEARTRAFLIERFWVLERSVDIDGADFLIQLRDLDRRFTSRSAPRLAVVQSKYLQDKDTVHYIPTRYVVDDDGKAIVGFFALLHIGPADDDLMYLLSADDIMKHLALKQGDKEEPKKFVVGVAARREDFRIKSKREALNQIEYGLRHQSPAQERFFLNRLNIPGYTISEEQIDFKWTSAVPTFNTRLPQLFQLLKSDLQRTVRNIDDALQLVERILGETDPVRALALIKELQDEYDTRGGYIKELRFNVDEGHKWGELQDCIDEYNQRVNALQSANHFASFQAVSEGISKELESARPAIQKDSSKGKVVTLEVTLDPVSFTTIGVSVEVVDSASDISPNVSPSVITEHVTLQPRNEYDTTYPARSLRALHSGAMKQLFAKMLPQFQQT